MSEIEPELTRGQKAAHTRAYDGFVQQLADTRKQILGWHTEIENFHKELLVDSEGHESIKVRIQSLVDEIKERKEAIDGTQNEISAIKKKISGDDGKTGISGEVDLLAENVREQSADITEYLKRLESAIRKIDGETDEQGNKTSEGYLSKIEGLDKAYSNSLRDNDSKGKQLISDIEEILAGASNVELAKGSEIQKINARKSKWLWGAGFTLSIALMTALGLVFYFRPSDVGPLMQTVLGLSTGTETKLTTETVTFIWIGYPVSEVGHLCASNLVCIEML